MSKTSEHPLPTKRLHTTWHKIVKYMNDLEKYLGKDLTKVSDVPIDLDNPSNRDNLWNQILEIVTIISSVKIYEEQVDTLRYLYGKIIQFHRQALDFFYPRVAHIPPGCTTSRMEKIEQGVYPHLFNGKIKENTKFHETLIIKLEIVGYASEALQKIYDVLKETLYSKQKQNERASPSLRILLVQYQEQLNQLIQKLAVYDAFLALHFPEFKIHLVSYDQGNIKQPRKLSKKAIS